MRRMGLRSKKIIHYPQEIRQYFRSTKSVSSWVIQNYLSKEYDRIRRNLQGYVISSIYSAKIVFILFWNTHGFVLEFSKRSSISYGPEEDWKWNNSMDRLDIFTMKSYTPAYQNDVKIKRPILKQIDITLR